MRIRFQADANLDPDIGRGIKRRNPTIDWQPAQGLIPDGTPDPDILLFAARQGRVVVTGDLRTFSAHFVQFIEAHTSPGLIVIPSNVTLGESIHRLWLAWTRWSAEDVEGQMRWLTRDLL